MILKHTAVVGFLNRLQLLCFGIMNRILCFSLPKNKGQVGFNEHKIAMFLEAVTSSAGTIINIRYLGN